MINFIKKLREMAREVYYAKRRFPVYLGQQVPNRSITICVGFVKNLSDPKIRKCWTIATTAEISLVLHMKSATG